MALFGARSIFLLLGALLLAFVGSSMSDVTTLTPKVPIPTPPLPGPDDKCSKVAHFCGKSMIEPKDKEYTCCEDATCDKKASLWGPDGGICRDKSVHEKNPDCMTEGEICGSSGSVTVTCCGGAECNLGAQNTEAGNKEGTCGASATTQGSIDEGGVTAGGDQTQTSLLIATTLALAVAVFGQLD